MIAPVQFARFAIVGIVSNAVLYGLYVFATHYGIEHKLAMSGLFAIGALQTFLFNRRWSFNHRGSQRRAMCRYMVAYGAAYAMNLSVMLILVDKEGLPDRYVQAVMIGVVALFLFAMQRYWVFSNVQNLPSRK